MANPSLRGLKRKLKQILSGSEEEEESDEISKSTKRKNDFISSDDLAKQLKLLYGKVEDSVYEHISNFGKYLTYADFNRVLDGERKEEQYEDSYDEQEFESVFYVTYDEESDDMDISNPDACDYIINGRKSADANVDSKDENKPSSDEQRE